MNSSLMHLQRWGAYRGFIIPCFYFPPDYKLPRFQFMNIERWLNLRCVPTRSMISGYFFETDPPLYSQLSPCMNETVCVSCFMMQYQQEGNWGVLTVLWGHESWLQLAIQLCCHPKPSLLCDAPKHYTSAKYHQLAAAVVYSRYIHSVSVMCQSE